MKLSLFENVGAFAQLGMQSLRRYDLTPFQLFRVLLVSPAEQTRYEQLQSRRSVLLVRLRKLLQLFGNACPLGDERKDEKLIRILIDGKERFRFEGKRGEVKIE